MSSNFAIKSQNNNLQLLIALLIAAMDFFHLGIIYPLFAEMMVEPSGTMFWGSQPWERSMIYAAFIAAFPFGQFIGSPYLGKLSDHYGRRTILFYTVAGSGVGMAMCALGVQVSSPLLILIGRLLGGLMGGNLSLAYAAIVDLSNPQTKVKNLSLIPLATASGFTLGPLMTGLLGTQKSISFFGPSLSLWVASAFSLISWCAIWKFEDKKPDLNVERSAKKSLLLQDKKLWRPISIVFLMITANFLLVQFIGPFAIDIFKENLTGVSWIYVNLSLSVAFGHIFLTRNLASIASPRVLLPWALGALACALIAVSLSASLLILHMTLAIAMICCAVAYTNVMAFLSDHADANRQGEIMGLGVSAQCLAEWLPPICLGAFTASFSALPFLCGSAACLMGMALLPKKAKALFLNSGLDGRGGRSGQSAKFSLV